VIDGDTLEIHGERIRILDIDAPESRQTCRALSGSEWKCGQWVARAVRVDWSAHREPPKAPRAVERRRIKHDRSNSGTKHASFESDLPAAIATLIVMVIVENDIGSSIGILPAPSP